ncbi:MAG: hypothetical protein HKN16_11570, partial [Saprospiraceae bacterium]|nr:hypothetical protein [Saprospiraceae bacterium]
LRGTTTELNQLLAGSRSSLTGTFSNFESISSNLKNNDAQINQILQNFAELSEKFNKMELNQAVENTNGTLISAKTTLDNLQGTLEKANSAFDGITKLLEDINAGQGSLGKLAKDEALYDKLNSAGREMELLLQDVRLNPKRYTRILSKKEKPYEYPADDPSKGQEN